MPEFIQPEIKTVGLGEKIEFNHSLENSELKEKFIKMYEQDPDSAWLKLITTIISTGSPEEILKHYGIDGQKWGVRNGPPYPLDRKKNKKWSITEKSGAKKELTKREKQLGKRAKAKLVKENMDDLTIEEIQNLIKRIELEEKLNLMALPEKKDGRELALKILGKFGEVAVTVAIPLLIRELQKESTIKETPVSKKIHTTLDFM